MEFIHSIGWAEIVTQGLILLIVGFAIPKAIAYFNIKIDDKTRGYLSSAITNGIRSSVTAVSTATKDEKLTDTIKRALEDEGLRADVVAATQDYIKNSVPDALKRLGVDDASLVTVIQGKLDQAISELAFDRKHTIQAVADTESAKRTVDAA